MARPLFKPRPAKALASAWIHLKKKIRAPYQSNALPIAAGVVGALVAGPAVGFFCHAAIEWNNSFAHGSGLLSSFLPIIPPGKAMLDSVMAGAGAGAGMAGFLAGGLAGETLGRRLRGMRGAKEARDTQSVHGRIDEALTALDGLRERLASPKPPGSAR